MDLNVEIWEQLPNDIFENILSFLTVLVLCRFKIVCKKWTKIICKPSFHYLSWKNAKQKSQFIVARSMIKSWRYTTLGGQGYLNEYPGWSFLDLNAKQWYTMKVSEVAQKHRDDIVTRTKSMDGGLVCQLCMHSRVKDSNFLVVCNPITNITKELPNPPLYCDLINSSYYPLLQLLVNIQACTFQIFYLYNIDNCGTNTNGLQLYVYKSATNQWQRLSDPPIELTLQYANCWIVFEKMLYVLFTGSSYDLILLSYDIQIDIWNEVIVPIYNNNENKNSQLVVSDNCLFLVVFDDVISDSRVWELKIYEISIINKSISVVVLMPLALIKQIIFGVHGQPHAFTKDYSSIIHIGNVLAMGFDKSIVLILSSYPIAYNLVTSEWRVFPPNPLGNFVKGCIYPLEIYNAHCMNLSLSWP